MFVKQIIIFISLFAIAEVGFSNGTHSKEGVEKLYDKAWDYLNINLDSANKYAELQKKIAIDIRDELGVIKAYYILGYISYMQKYFDISAINYFKALRLITNNNSKEYLIRKMLLLQNLALVYDETYKRTEAIQYNLEALEIARRFDRHDNVSSLTFNLGLIYEKEKDFENALKWYTLSRENVQKYPNEYLRARISNCIGNVYNKTERYDKARECYLFALKLSETNESLKEERAFYVSNLGENALKEGNIKKANEYYSEALSIAITLNNSDKIKAICNNLGALYVRQKEFEKAISYYEETISLGKEKNIDDRLKTAYKGIAEAYDAMGNYQLASEFKSKYMNQVELLAQTKDKLQEQNAQYRMKEVEWQMERLAKNEQIQFYKTSVFWFRVSLSLIVLVLFMISYFTYKYYRKIAIAKRLLEY